MTGKQKIIVAVLILADAAVILGLVAVMTGSRPVSPPPSATPLPIACRRESARLLAQAGVGGTVTGSDGVLHFDLAVSLAPTENVTTGVELAAQAVWTAFDVAASLWEQEECAVFEGVDVAIAVVEDGQAIGHISARVDVADLVAFEQGDLSEEAFIERVSYAATTD